MTNLAASYGKQIWSDRAKGELEEGRGSLL